MMISKRSLSLAELAYLDSHNDYLNPFLDELHKAESLLKELLY